VREGSRGGDDGVGRLYGQRVKARIRRGLATGVEVERRGRRVESIIEMAGYGQEEGEGGEVVGVVI